MPIEKIMTFLKTTLSTEVSRYVLQRSIILSKLIILNSIPRYPILNELYVSISAVFPIKYLILAFQ